MARKLAWLRRLYAWILSRLPRKMFLSREYFDVYENRGWHLTPVHYYEPIPDTRKLPDHLWEGCSDLVGIDMREQCQLTLLDAFSGKFGSEYTSFAREKTSDPTEFYISNSSFAPVDAAVLHCIIREFRPRKMVEIGSGMSTLVAANAIKQNEAEFGEGCELVAIEPYPREYLRGGIPGLARLISKQVQDVPLSEFTDLDRNDILFIDSSHVVRTGGDVTREYLEILPRLTPGVLVHAHDIFFPHEYPKDWLMERHHFWTEQYLLQAFLAFNDSFEVVWGSNYMGAKHPDKTNECFPFVVMGKGGSSFWIRRRHQPSGRESHLESDHGLADRRPVMKAGASIRP